MSSFFTSLADKAQSALKDTPIGNHIPGTSGKSSANANADSSTGSRTLDHLTHQLRTFQQQYSSSTPPLQKLITTGKGVAIDFDNVARGTQAHGKELYLWGQSEAEDLKDVSDRLGWLNYVQGTLSQSLATKLDAARGPYKDLRVADAKLAPHRAQLTALEGQIRKLDSEGRRGNEKRIAEIEAQITKLESESVDENAELEILKRKAIKEGERLKWEAYREYAEKLLLITQAATAILPVIPSVPPTKLEPYAGATTTTNVRAALQKALDAYTPGSDNLVLPEASPADLQRHDTRSFGQTHAKELDNIGSTDPAQPTVPLSPPPTTTSFPPPPHHSSQSSVSSVQTQTAPVPIGRPSSGSATSPPAGQQTMPLNPSALNQAPAPIPVSPDDSKVTSPIVAPDPEEPKVGVTSALPTVAETGVPQSSGPGGPGPASGSLLSIKSDHDAQKAGDLPGYGGSSAAPPPEKAPAQWEKYESAEEEKKRLQREERERVLQGQSGQSAQGGPPPGGEGEGEGPPAYNEF
ncbi:hypothetical protein EUX98_g4111 [Antrodiella citrinella]|uniref:Sphingolipid long chain base-responsive protein LSP1 n=1 Tax=Antrodiella citrinella TaxID=2447956 RepID=A0A4S4MWU0_9APHY|nr:hypothetical protein EUX98_g4111 [Antrodiella citrinella]